MGFFKDIGRALKKGVEAIGDVGDKIVEGVGEAAGWVTDKVGDSIEGVTRVVAGDKAADAVKKTFDDKIEPGIQRGVEGFARIIATPITALDDIAQKGLIDGVIHNAAEGTQDIIGGVTRTIGGQNAEAKFDTFYDEKIQPTLETVAGIAGRIALVAVPGGALLLAADAASEVGSLGYRAVSGEKISTQDYIGAALGIAGSAGAAIGAVTRTGLAVGSKVTTEATEAAVGAATKKATVGYVAKETIADESQSIVEDQATSAIANKIDKATVAKYSVTADTYPDTDTNTDTLALEYGDYAQPVFNNTSVSTPSYFLPTV